MLDALAPVMLLIGIPAVVLLTISHLNLRDFRRERASVRPHTGGRTVESAPPYSSDGPIPWASRRVR
ncbi:hypothetical protein [Rhodococcus ruber]|uniref:hypothetical protein n=1 Tax=Rhodococcus ruber TaxID=1830 RepID=UPI0003462680|nr:hypothetical protein [Rhodococcus ruber]